MVNVKNKIKPFFKIKKLKKLSLNPILILLIIFSFENSAYSLSDYQIRKICQKNQRRSTCIKNLKTKKLNLLQGNKIEIPVIPLE